MSVSPFKFNFFLLFKLPSAFFCGVRVVSINEQECIVSVKKRWINQNPFDSLYFAVEAMAAELSTGMLLNSHTQKLGKEISMLVISNKNKFLKKAVGRITFVCQQGNEIPKVLQGMIKTNVGQTFWLKSVGTDE